MSTERWSVDQPSYDTTNVPSSGLPFVLAPVSTSITSTSSQPADFHHSTSYSTTSEPFALGGARHATSSDVHASPTGTAADAGTVASVTPMPYSIASGADDDARLAGDAMRGAPAPSELTDATRTKYGVPASSAGSSYSNH